MSFTIEQLTEDGVEDVARCHAACWGEAYAGFIAQEHLCKMTDVPTRVERWRSRFANSTSPIWVAHSANGEVVGLAHAGLARDEYPQLPALELYTLYVRASAYGTGLAERLTNAAIGGHAAWLWVFTPNARARRFYIKQGFAATGEEKLDPQTDVMEMQMARPPRSA